MTWTSPENQIKFIQINRGSPNIPKTQLTECHPEFPFFSDVYKYEVLSKYICLHVLRSHREAAQVVARRWTRCKVEPYLRRMSSFMQPHHTVLTVEVWSKGRIHLKHHGREQRGHDVHHQYVQFHHGYPQFKTQRRLHLCNSWLAKRTERMEMFQGAGAIQAC